MDLGIKGRTAIVCGASKGLGRACAEALAAEGVDLVLTARNGDQLEADGRRRARKQFGVNVVTAAGDITTRGRHGRRAGRLSRAGHPDQQRRWAAGRRLAQLSSASNGWPPRKATWSPPSLLIRSVVDGMAERGFGRIINITSAMVKQPNPNLSLSVAARLGLTGFVKAIAPSYVKSNVTINNLLPEQFATDRLKSNVAKLSGNTDKTIDELMEASAKASTAGRFGRVEEFGAVCAFYCSEHAGFLTGQNVMLDGGRYPRRVLGFPSR